MNENIKTLIFAGIGIVLAGLAYATLPAPSQNVLPKLTGQPLFAKFTDSTKAAGLEIVRYDKDKHKVESLKVEKSGGIWKLPSHGGYPADAQDQLKDAAGSLLGVKALGLATEFPEEHHLFGVLDPSQKFDDSKKEDVGMLVVIRDEKGEELARMIIGKAVKDPPGQRFVRVAEGTTFTDDVYVAKIDTEKLPTEFNKWIERDLLKLNPNDVKKLTLKDYSVLEQQGGYAAEKRMEAAVSWDTLSAVWNLDRFQLFTRGVPHDAALGDGEELNKQKLDDMKTALDDLKIEDVRRKPTGAATDPKFVQAQLKMGFIPAKDRLYSTNGEVHVDLLDGVRYILRFGDISGVQAGSDGKKLNRYLLVNAELTDDVLQQPMLEPEPAGPAAPPATPPTTPPAAEPPKSNGGACQDEPKGEAKEEPKAAEPAKEKAKVDDKGGKTKAKAGAEPPTKSVKPIAKPDPAQLELDRIKKANQRKMDEYTLKKKKAEAKVKDLNSRFGDWYYVISEDTYKKIHLGRTDIIREGASAKETGFGIDAFRLMEKNGINPPPPPPPPTGGRGPGGPGGFPGGLPPGFPPM